MLNVCVASGCDYRRSFEEKGSVFQFPNDSALAFRLAFWYLRKCWMSAFLWDVIIVDSLKKNDQFFSFQTTQLSLFVLLFDIFEKMLNVCVPLGCDYRRFFEEKRSFFQFPNASALAFRLAWKISIVRTSFLQNISGCVKFTLRRNLLFALIGLSDKEGDGMKFPLRKLNCSRVFWQ